MGRTCHDVGQDGTQPQGGSSVVRPSSAGPGQGYRGPGHYPVSGRAAHSILPHILTPEVVIPELGASCDCSNLHGNPTLRLSCVLWTNLHKGLDIPYPLLFPPEQFIFSIRQNTEKLQQKNCSRFASTHWRSKMVEPSVPGTSIQHA